MNLPGATRYRLLLLVGLVGDGQLMTAFGTTAGEELTAVLRRHFAAETVLVKTTALGGLKRSFHRSSSFGAAAAGRPEGSKGAQR